MCQTVFSIVNTGSLLIPKSSGVSTANPVSQMKKLRLKLSNLHEVAVIWQHRSSVRLHMRQQSDSANWN